MAQHLVATRRSGRGGRAMPTTASVPKLAYGQRDFEREALRRSSKGRLDCSLWSRKPEGSERSTRRQGSATDNECVCSFEGRCQSSSRRNEFESNKNNESREVLPSGIS